MLTRKLIFLRRLTQGLVASFVIALLSLGFSTSTVSGQETAPPDGFESLFNGSDLTGWYAIETYNPRDFEKLPAEELAKKIEAAKKTTGEHWRVEGDEIVNDGTGPYLTTERSFQDFELLIDYKTVPEADSGIYLKATPQVQIWDFTEAAGKWDLGADKGSGGLWNNSKGAAGKDPLELADNPLGQWNKFRIVQIGSRTSVWLNGKLIVNHAVMENYWDRKLPLIGSGPIQLQTHGGEIRWRNIFVREIPLEESNRVLAEKRSDGFEKVFNGKDFTGWKGPVENYEIAQGSLRCKSGAGGTIYTETSYSDFAARFEFKLPPGGNNGLAIRYPGEGDTAYVGMAELQVLDSEHEKYASLDARQYHGSAYGMIAAHRGYLRSAGEWNFQEVTVVGSKIKVELNGTVILDGDLSTITEYMDDKPHPGKDRTEGYFGFAGHNDPVEFRNVMIKDLAGEKEGSGKEE